jgi:error-prone DNA polymerase
MEPLSKNLGFGIWNLFSICIGFRKMTDSPAKSQIPNPKSQIPYAELHCKTNFSFLEGASHADELVTRSAELGYAALAVTDRNSLAGVVRAHGAAKDAGLKLLIGAEITPSDAPPIVLLATDRAAYGRLSRLITRGRRNAEKGQCRLTFDDVAEHADGLLGAVGAMGDEFAHSLTNYRDVFADRLYLLAELHRGVDDRQHLQRLIDLSGQWRIPLVAAGDVHYHVPQRSALHDVLTATRHNTTVADAGRRLYPNAQRHLKSIDEITTAFASAPQAVARTLEVADRCDFSLDELRYDYPEELVPGGRTPMEHLTRLTWDGAQQRYPGGLPDKVRRLLLHELQLIEQLRYEAYFLTVWDLVHFARERNILCQGRGSAANSAVCYCLGITSVDPAQTDVLFERFISRERDEAPDIDVDFEHERREEVLQYLYEKYGRERAGMTAEAICYRPRSAVRDVGKAIGLSLDRVDALAKNLEGYSQEPRLAERCRQVGIDPESRLGRQLVTLVDELVGFPRHLSQHVGGMVITHSPLCELVPIENAAMADRTVIQWNKDDLDELGILKIDCLSLGMLTAIRKCFALIKQHHGRDLTLANIPAGDTDVYDMICRADTMGVFQIESRAQMSMLPRLKPRCFYDLVIEVAIVRPGPIQGNMVHPYLRRRNGEESFTFPNEAIREVLGKTLGIPLFQEQAMRLAVVAAGFTPGEADQLRRAMGAWRRPGVIDQFRTKLLDGMREKGFSQQFAEHVFSQIRGFGEYGFPESHAASFALLVYVSAWLKCHHPAAFTAALINSQPMGFYAPAQLVRDVKSHGVEVLPADVNYSGWDCTLEEISLSLRLGLRMLHGLPQSQAEVIEAARLDGPFLSQHDFARRTGLARSIVMRLAAADALASLGRDRRGAMWEALAQQKSKRSLPLLDGLDNNADDAPVELPEMKLHDQVVADYQTTGLSLRAHPLQEFRPQLEDLGVTPAEQLAEIPNNRPVRVAGLVLLRQRPSTAHGITFVTLEDETGTSNLVIHQRTWERYFRVARHAAAMIAHGRLEAKDSVIHVVVNRLEDLSERLRDLKSRSRDFR